MSPSLGRPAPVPRWAERTELLADFDLGKQRRGVIYMLTFPDGMRYIGMSVDLEGRMRAHRGGSTKCKKLCEWTAEYGWDAVVQNVLARPRVEELCAQERWHIAHHGTRWPQGLNMTDGGEWPDPEAVRLSWQDEEVRERHHQGRVRAWADPTKRENIMAGREASPKVQAAKEAKLQNGPEANAKRTVTWESQREGRLAGLTGKARQQKEARMNRDRERHRRKVAAKKSAPGPPASAQANEKASANGKAPMVCGYETSDGE